jgi:hypothetical protein
MLPACHAARAGNEPAPDVFMRRRCNTGWDAGPRSGRHVRAAGVLEIGEQWAGGLRTARSPGRERLGPLGRVHQLEGQLSPRGVPVQPEQRRDQRLQPDRSTAAVDPGDLVNTCSDDGSRSSPEAALEQLGSVTWSSAPVRDAFVQQHRRAARTRPLLLSDDDLAFLDGARLQRCRRGRSCSGPATATTRSVVGVRRAQSGVRTPAARALVIHRASVQVTEPYAA